jgi:hypothetical protein
MQDAGITPLMISGVACAPEKAARKRRSNIPSPAQDTDAGSHAPRRLHQLPLQRGSHASGTQDEGDSQEGSDNLDSGAAVWLWSVAPIRSTGASLHRLDNLEALELGMA